MQDDLDVERLRSSVRIRISDSRIYGMCVGILYFYSYSSVTLRDALLALPIPSAKIVWRQDGVHRKERERERERECKSWREGRRTEDKCRSNWWCFCSSSSDFKRNLRGPL